MPQDREVLHVALGPAACHVSAHWLNLQGLSATSSAASGGGDSDAAAPLCSPAVQHFAHVLAGNGRDAVYVPRAILVDGPTAAPSPIMPHQQQQANEQPEQQQQQQQQDPLHFPTWSGAVERMNVGQQQQEQQEQQYHSFDERESSSKIMRTMQQQQQKVSDDFRQQAAQLAYGAYSRYRVLPSQQQQQSYVSSGRHVDWDGEMEEEEEPDEDEEEWKRQQELQRKQTWQRQQFRPTQDALDDFWNNTGVASTANDTTTATDPSTNTANNSSPKSIQDAPSPSTSTIQEYTNHSLLWRDYLMPPLHPQTSLDTPAVAGFDQVVRTYHSAIQDDSNRAWFEDVLWEGVRRRLEDCDACQGLTLIETSVDDGGAFAGWGTALLREWNDECPHTGQLVLSLENGRDKNDADAPPASTTNMSTDDAPEILQNKNSSRDIAKQQRRVRQQVQRALQLCDQTELADAVLSLQLPNLNSNNNKSTATSAALMAAALESATLPFRLQNNNGTNRSMIGMQSYYAGSYSGSHPFGTAHNLSYREWVRDLQRQSANRHVLELDALLPNNNSNASGGIDLYSRLQQGTSLERDHRMRQPGYSGGIHRGRDVLPGEWMNTSTTTTTTNTSHGGLLSTLSPTAENANPRNGDRSLHHHFALSTSLRPTTNHKTTATVSNYVACLMEGMGIRYRPEQSVATVVNQSLAQLTQDGYGAGSYWKFLFQAAPTIEKKQQHPATYLPSLPILATVGNTTRVYPYLHQTAHDAQQMLSRRHVHWLQRAAAQNLLPEADDCTDAVAACWDLRDSYQPPEGSGLVVDEEGTYFDGR